MTKDSFLRIVSLLSQNYPEYRPKTLSSIKVITIQSVIWSNATNTAPVCSGSKYFQFSKVKSIERRQQRHNFTFYFGVLCAMNSIPCAYCCIHGEPSLLTKSRRVFGEMLKYVIAASSRAFFARLRLNGGATETGLAVINDGGNAFDGPCKNLLAKG